MNILAQFHRVTVEIQDVYETGGEKRAAIRALEGRPFVGGDRWPVRTAFTTVAIHDLTRIERSEHANRHNSAR